MKAIIVDDDTLDRLKRWNAGTLPLTVGERDRLLTQLGDVAPVEINENGPAGALEIVNEWRQRTEKAEEALKFVRAERDAASASLEHISRILEPRARDVFGALVDPPKPPGPVELAEFASARIGDLSSELATIQQERRTLVSELERARETERKLRSAGPAGGYGALIHAIGLIRDGLEHVPQDALATHTLEALDDAIELGRAAYEKSVGDPAGTPNDLTADDVNLLIELAAHDLRACDMGSRELTALARLVAIGEADTHARTT